MTQQLIDVFGRTGYAQPPAPPAAPPTASAAPGDVRLDPEGFVTGKDLVALQEQAVRQHIAPMLQRSIDLAASANLAVVRERHAKHFARYGPEITARLATVSRDQWTIDNLETVVKLVLVDHLSDLAREEGERLAATMVPTTRSIGGAGSEPVSAETQTLSLESDVVPVQWREHAKRAGLTMQSIREFCVANDMTVDEFFKQFESKAVGDAVIDVGRFGHG